MDTLRMIYKEHKRGCVPGKTAKNWCIFCEAEAEARVNERKKVAAEVMEMLKMWDAAIQDKSQVKA
jgi:hypothetical protein